ncbi:envelope stress response membrane protein PspB [Vibrio sp. AK197]
MSSVLFSGPLIVFLIFVAPLWLILHYRSKRKMSHSLSGEEHERLDQLTEKARGLQQRVETLERILDAESPSWRNRYD